ncbi:MAG: restriction endonuclease subunit S [Scytolyngbya sp. HA4215-MV1]|jgi:type I restriction enzyme S subunit|nr:restriction endonuclease subunit S [Scytolyngbya sp. HA4215-MV1]
MVELLDVEVSRDWKQVVLEEVCKTTSGGTPSRSRADYYDGKIPWVKSGELKDCFIFRTEEAISEEAIQKSSAKVFPKDTLLIALYGATVGKLGILKIDAATNQAVCAIFPNEEVDRSYLYFYLLSQRENLIDAGTGGAQPNISQEIIRGLKIPLPPIAEQKRIASIAQKCDRLRRTRRYTQQLSDGYLRSIFLEMFGDPWQNPQGWDIQELGELLELTPHIGTITPAQEIGEQLCVRVGEVGNWYIELNSCKRITLTGHEFKRFSLRVGDIVLARAIGSEAHLGKLSILQKTEIPVVFDAHLMRLRLNQSLILPEFFMVFMKTPGGRARFMKQSRQTAVQFNINGQQIADIQVPLPPLPLQEKFAQIVQRFERLRIQQREADRQAEHLFQTVLHRAFRGEL